MSDEKRHGVYLMFPDPEEALRVLEEMERERKRTGEVCICGHSTKAHTTIKATGLVVCTPGRIQCLCKEVRAVLKGDNLRLFMASTTGYGPAHALGKGIMRTQKRGLTVEWISDVICDVCGSNDQIFPVAINRFSEQIANESTGIDKLLCHRCRFDMFGAY